MKKIIIVFVVSVVILLLVVSQFSFKIGDIQFGKQPSYKTLQNGNFENSNFYKYNYSNSKLSVINLWATWCGPCVGEMPELNSVQEEFKNDSISFLSFSIDNDSIKLVNFLNKKRFKFKDITLENLKYRTAILNTLEGKKTNELLSSQSVPITYLVRNRKILERIEGTIAKEELIALIEKHK